MNAVTYRADDGDTYTLRDLVDTEDGPTADGVDARDLAALRALDVGASHTIDLGAGGLLTLTRVS